MRRWLAALSLLAAVAGASHARQAIGTASDAASRWTYTVVPQQDTYVVDWTGSDPIVETHHDEPALYVSFDDVPPKRYVAYLRFELPALADESLPLGATLWLHRGNCPEPLGAQSAYYGTHMVHEQWSAEDLDDTYLPPYGASFDHQFPYSGTDDWIAWDATHAVSQWYRGVENHGLALDAVGPWTLHTYCKFSSSEGDHPPRLELTLPSHDAGTLFVPSAYQHNAPW